MAHSLGIPAAEVPVFKAWSHYLLAGPTAWARVEHPTWDATVRAKVWESIRTDPGPADPMINFLLWKQSLDPPRFAHYHPRLAPALHRIAMTRRAHTPVPQAMTPTNHSGALWGTPIAPTHRRRTFTTSQLDLVAPPVPEPGMLLLSAVMTAWAYRRIHGRRRDREG